MSGSGAFQKKLNTVITSAMDQKPSAQNTPTKQSTASAAPKRTIGMRWPARSASSPHTLGATILVPIRIAISTPMAAG